ncbi:MAG: hypothetical protein IPH12_05655 [Saprospirales bacterium]|nr:hypothetical protein [Saprospirales bacterium]
MKRLSIQCAWAVLVLMSLPACEGEKILVANFNGNTIGQAPAQNQEVGTVRVDGLSGNCTVEKINGLTPNWVRVLRPNIPNTVTGLQGTAIQAKGPGEYTFTTTLYIPDGDGVATVQFEPHNQAVQQYTNFLHIDFLADNKVRVNDDPNKTFGSFPRNQPFILQVVLNIQPNGSSADISLSGANATGQMNVTGLINQFAMQFGSIRVWMGFPWVGQFYATNMVLRYKAP